MQDMDYWQLNQTDVLFSQLESVDVAEERRNH